MLNEENYVQKLKNKISTHESSNDSFLYSVIDKWDEHEVKGFINILNIKHAIFTKDIAKII